VSYLDAVRSAFDALRVNPTRSILTVLGIIIGVAAVILVVAIGSGAREVVVSRIKSLGSNLLVIEPGSRTSSGVRIAESGGARITEDDAEALLAELPSVQYAVPTVKGGVQAVRGSRNWPTVVYGVGDGFLEAHDWPLTEGRPFDPDELTAGRLVALIGQTTARRLFDDADPLGATVRVQDTNFTVVGLLSRKGQTTSGKDQDDAILVPLHAAKRRVVGSNPINPRAVESILVKVGDGYDMHAAQADVQDLLRARHHVDPGEDDDFSVENLDDVLSIKDASTKAFATLVAAIASVSLLVGGIGIMNIMLVSVLERVREIGIRMAVGARRADIMSQFLIESAALSVAGGALGLVIGIVAAIVTAQLAGWPAIISPFAIALAIGSSLAVGLGFGFYPARRAAALDPIEALRRD
jgi:putative ABC transport system permease protein